ALLCLGLALGVREQQKHQIESSAAARWAWRELPAPFKRYMVVVALFTLGNSSNMFLLLRAREVGVSEAQIPLLWAAVSAVATLFSTPLSAWSDRVGRVRLLAAGYLAYALFYVAMGALGESRWWLYALFGFYGLFMAATEGVEKALVADLAPVDRQGSAYGWFNLTAGLFLLPASVSFGWLYQQVSPAAAFGFSAACAALAALLLTLWVRAECQRLS
ncbi:MAG TPA: MFS transporter, partial [Aquabacterium sp.]|nr:MFS transporter [Aquabacterium sp.]